MRIYALLMILVLVLAACQQAPPGEGTYQERDFKIKDSVNTLTFDSVEAYQDFIRSNSGGAPGGIGIAFRMDGDMAMAEESGVPAPAAGQKIAADFSETNIQVRGVDEADIIKTDGEYIYTVTDRTLFVIRAYPGEEAEVVSTMKFDSYVSGLFIEGDRLAVMGNFQDIEFFRGKDFTPRHGMTFLNIYDISDKNDPELLKEYKLEGSYTNARMTGGSVYVVVSDRPSIRPDWPTPVIFEGDAIKPMPVDDIRYFDIPYREPQLVTVHAVDLDGFERDSKSVLAEWGQNLYMSQGSIYITYNEQVNEWEIRQDIMKGLLEPLLTESDRQLIQKIKRTDDEILSQREKEQKILEIHMNYLNWMTREEQDEIQDKAEDLLEKELEKYNYFEYTVINRISYGEGLDVEANGKVPGRVINQFSMDEHDGVFRIATTVSPRWSRFGKQRTESVNNVYTLDMDLEVMDSLEGLAEGESIFSTRFMGDRLYMVTFEQVDPFFVIDLSNPERIQELGQLKIPGFSRYLHPYDENTIIGIGRDATMSGRTRGLKISLFDVSDVSDPEEIAKYVSDDRYSQSSAEYEHKAFLFSREKNLLVIPAYSYRHDEADGYNGALVFRISRDEIEARGLIDHSEGGRLYGPAVERSLYIEDLLYTKSPGLLRINRIDDLESVKDVPLKTGKAGDIPVY